MSIEELTAAQQEIGSEITRMCSNFKKDSSSRKTAQYLRLKSTALDEAWQTFDSADSKIREKYGKDLLHPYFAADYYNQVREVYDKIRKEMGILLDKTEATGSDSLKTTTQQVDHRHETATGALESVERPKSAPQGLSTNNTINLDIASSDLSKIHYNCDNQPLAVLTRRVQAVFDSIRRTLDSLNPADRLRSPQFCRGKYEKLQQSWKQAEELHYEIMGIGDFNTVDYNNQEFLELEQTVDEAMIQLTELSNNHLAAPVTSLPQQSSVPSSVMSLPKIALPKFDGDYLKWTQFHDLFTEVVDTQPIAKCQKMWYLKTSLQGEAERLIRHLAISESNYDVAWRIISDRFENQRLLASAFISKLLSQPTVVADNANAIKTLHDVTQECLLALEHMNIPIHEWDPLLLHILIGKLDKTTHMLYEQSLKEPKKLQSIKDFLRFLETRFQSLEALGKKERGVSHETHRKLMLRSLAATAPTQHCSLCKKLHSLFACDAFLKLTPSKRLTWVRNAKLCVNCLKPGHVAAECSSSNCRKCSKKHNSLLHLEDGTLTARLGHKKASEESTGVTASGTSVKKTDSIPDQLKGYVMLGTAIVTIESNNGISLNCRAILDSGSQLNLITEDITKRLQINGVPDCLQIEGIGQQKQRSQKRVNVTIKSKSSGFSSQIEAHVLPRIISPQPAHIIDISSWKLPKNVVLADPNFFKPDTIDLLIGADLFYSILSVGQIKLGKNLPIMQNTAFGWTVAGNVKRVPQIAAACGICSEDDKLNHQIEKFWRLEEPTNEKRLLSTEEKFCEGHFRENTSRDLGGRFIVKLPFPRPASHLGESKEIAYQRFMALERKLSKNSDLKAEYVKFMNEYIQLGHMTEVNLASVEKPHFFFPHHCVLRPESSTTKLRVVFDGSAKTSSNTSLNMLLGIGPVVQDDVFTLLLRFRMPKFVFTADIEKMYRQILVHEEDRRFQLIWWREDPQQKLRCYKLNTVTYGTSAAPYLATRCLKELAIQNERTFPLGAEALTQGCYVDDIMTGANSLTSALEMQQQLQQMLKGAGMNLRKWCANHPRLLQNIPDKDQAVQLDFHDRIEEHIKTVGLTWLPKSDLFAIKTSWPESSRVTKRSVYSETAHLFDPLGIMGPAIITAKIFLQKLWDLKLDWDASLPQHLHTEWLEFREGLKELSNIRFPRHLFAQQIPSKVQLHIFCDASEKAFGAAAYIRSSNKDNIAVIRLLCAKSRVAPMKQVTLPRLELCAAKLGAELGHRIQRDLNLTDAATCYWSDSEITLSWIQSTSSSLPTFVANRVSIIQQLTAIPQWRHVRSKENPADLLSRGIPPEKLAQCNMWFYGPTFLHGASSLWPPPFVNKNKHEQDDQTALSTIKVCDKSMWQTINHGNSFRKLQRIVAYVLRFVTKVKLCEHPTTRRSTRQGQSKSVDALSVTELKSAQEVIVRHMQEEELHDDINHIRKYQEVAKTSAISSLTPFLDEQGILRVGGRLEAANISFDAKHPMLLPYSHPFTKLLLEDIHKQNMHAGPQTLLALSRQSFWPIKGKTLVRSVVRNCVRCARMKPKLLSQIMGNLPAERIQPTRSFLNSGVDFCGPVWTHYKIRGKKPTKSYIAVFCCFSTKAIHLELVTDLTTQGFLGALRRFIARRGHCRNIYCDNATNFVGARNQLEELRQGILSRESTSKIQNTCSQMGTDFHMIPPRAPHFGGLWEASVKSAKYLLQRALAAASLTYEEMETAIVEVEAILNSRPITPMSSDPNDITALTPGHFLIGEPMKGIADAQAEPVNSTLLTRWKLVMQIKSDFWRRWSSEYLNQLQHRTKWRQRCQNVEPGTMVIIKDDNLPPLKWPLGRIVTTIKGSDDMVRVADVRTASGIVRRAIHRLAPLPIEATREEEQNSSDIDGQDTKGLQGRQVLRKRESKESTSSTEDEARDEMPNKRSRSSIGTTLLTFLITCLLVPSANGQPIKVQPFETSPGIYFENMGEVRIFANEWNLVAFYNLEKYWKEVESMQANLQKLRTICRQVPDHESCSRTTQQLDQINTEIEQGNHILHGHVAERIKRGAINIIGHVANVLFGVLDSDYADKMEKTIEQLNSDNTHMLQLFKNQTSIIDATMNIMRHDHEITYLQFKELGVHLEKMTEHIKGLDRILYQERITQLFHTATLQVMLQAFHLQRTQTALLDTLTDCHHGKLNSQLITPSQMSVQMQTIKKHLPHSLQLPVEENEGLNLYRLATTEGKLTEKYAIFRIKIPLISTEEFELFRIIPLPTVLNNSFVTIQPSSPYIAVNLHRDQYYPLTEDELHFCITMKEGKRLCKQQQPLHQRGSPVSACEINLINNNHYGSTCKTIQSRGGAHWIQLHTPNNWIYVLENSTTINTVCESNTTQQTLKGSGILTIASGCTIKQPLVTIQGHSVFPTITKLSYLPTSNITSAVDNSTMPSIAPVKFVYPSNTTDLDLVQKQLINIDDNFTSGLNPHHIHHFIIGYAALTVAIITLSCLIWKYYGIKITKGPQTQRRHINSKEFSVENHFQKGTAKQNEAGFRVDFSV